MEDVKKQLDDMRAKQPSTVKGGPCEKSVYVKLQQHHIVRQQYHGGAFVGNHIAKALRPKVIDEITGSPIHAVHVTNWM